MSGKLVFFHNPMSRAAIVHWLLHEAEVSYELKVIDFKKGEHKSPEFLKLNPMGKLPTILHGDEVVTECAAICAYVADAFPSRNLAPAVFDPARGAYYRWLFFAAGCVEPAAMAKAMGWSNEEKKGSIGFGSVEDTMSSLETMLEQSSKKGPYLLGEQFTAADVYVGAQLDWGMKFKSMEERPVFVEYVQRLQQRPAYKAFQEADRSILAEMSL